MVSGERLTLTLTGGAPWGFRLQGGGGFPLEVAKIRKRSSANEAGLCEGDVVLTINGYPISGKSHQSAMDVVDMAGDKLVFEVARSGKGPSKPMDPQRQPRIIPPAPAHARPGMVTSAQASYSTTDGNVRTDVNTEAFVVKGPGGKKITKTVTQERVTRFPTFVSPDPGSRHSFVSPEPGSTRSSFVSPEPSSIPSFVSPEPSNRSFASPEPFSTPSPRPASSASLQPGGHVSRSPNRSPLMWKPQSLSPDNRANIPQSHSQPASLNTTPAVWQPKGQSHSPSPIAPFGSHSTPETPKQQPNITPSVPGKKSQKKGGDKENEDPIMLSEQAKWEARYGPANVPKFSLDNFGSNTWGGRGNKKDFIPKKIEDPNYPMFGVPKISWHAPLNTEPMSEPELDTKPSNQQQRVPPPVPPKPSYTAPSPIPFKPEEQAVAGVEYHRPGMIRPPAQPNVKPAPPPPPMPPAPDAPSFGLLPKPKGFQPGYTSTPGHDEPDHHRPDHLPVFGPKVMFVPDEDSGLPQSPDRSDISSLAKKKVFSDSAFYADASHKYPTIDEQMSMCKRIAESLTSAANTRARGARMFAKRKRKADKWIHDQHPELFGFRSEYSSSTGDVADIHDLDSELYFEDGGAKPLFSFRIPKIAGQISEGQKMSMSKEEFERLRLAAPRVDHHAVSPNVCFSIAADLHKGGKNRGAKLFAKRQARVERFVIDESNVQKPPVETRLDHIIHSPQAPIKPSPWDAAAQGNMGAAFNRPSRSTIQPPTHNGPRHDLTADNQPSVLQGGNYNRKARGWQSGPAHSQPNYYRDGEEPIGSDELTTEGQQQHEQSQQWNSQNRSNSPILEDNIDGDPYNIQFGDYNRRIKAWPGSGAPSQPQMPAPPQSYNYSAQPNYNSLPKGFSYSANRANQSVGMCDL